MQWNSVFGLRRHFAFICILEGREQGLPEAELHASEANYRALAEQTGDGSGLPTSRSWCVDEWPLKAVSAPGEER